MNKHFEKNLVGNDYVVGDIHGCFSRLQQLLNYTILFDYSKDRLFCVGDLVDRGPESYMVLDWLSQPWFHSVKGNHEEMIINAFTTSNTQDINLSYNNGGRWFFELYFPEKQEPYVNAFLQLPLSITIDTDKGKVGIIHAEVFHNDWNIMQNATKKGTPEYPIYPIGGPGWSNRMANEYALWSRKKYKAQDQTIIQNIDTVYCGHTPLKQSTTLGNQVYIDTGAVYKDDGGFFTIIKL